MKYTETLLWILDKDSKWTPGDEYVKQNIAFVHSLGLKCDCVGWSELDLASPRAPEILEAIDAFCKENGWGVRGWYTREFAETQSDWYEIRFAKTKEGFDCGFIKMLADDGSNVYLYELKPYKELSVSAKEIGFDKLVPERFRNTCLQLGIEDVDFCWAPDKGKYEAAQYFYIFPHHAVSCLAGDGGFCYSNHGWSKLDLFKMKRIQQLGGALPRLAKSFYELNICLPRCYLASELPQGGFSSSNASKERRGGVEHILVHKATATQLLETKVLQPSMLMPIPVLDKYPAGYKVLEGYYQPPPSKQVRQELLQKYEALKATARPAWVVSEKDAVKMLRKAKKERKEDFQKKIPQGMAEEVGETEYGKLIPYYLVANGGYLSDEYQLLAFQCAVGENAEFQEKLRAEGLAENKPEGVVIAKCPDGDTVLLCKDDTVIRFSHEGPEIIGQWPSMPQFIVDVINENE